MCDRFFRNHVAVYPNPFAKCDQVRRREQASAISLGPANRIDHGANGALAVCACHMNDLEGTGATTFVEQPLDVFQAELDPEALQAVKPGQRFMVRQGTPHRSLPCSATACQERPPMFTARQ